jgi:hypothetical protein
MRTTLTICSIKRKENFFSKKKFDWRRQFRPDCSWKVESAKVKRRNEFDSNQLTRKPLSVFTSEERHNAARGNRNFKTGFMSDDST